MQKVGGSSPPSPTMKQYIIRHGRSGHNSGKTENLDSALIPDGVVQSRATGKFLSKEIEGEEFVLYTSPMLRCLMTTESIIKGGNLNLKVVVQPLIHESLSADAGSVVVPIRKKEFPEFDWSLMYEPITVGADDGAKLISRCAAAVDFSKEKSIFVSHGSTCIALGICATQENPKMRYWDHSISNASITKIVDRKIDWWGCVIHPSGGYADSKNHVDYCKKFTHDVHDSLEQARLSL